jgi:hypothetical protein
MVQTLLCAKLQTIVRQMAQRDNSPREQRYLSPLKKGSVPFFSFFS